jgi:endonuclease/exonuclease/phosphatase (EEP) superfamily protein YafD
MREGVQQRPDQYRLAWDSAGWQPRTRLAVPLVLALLALPVGLVWTVLRVFSPADDFPALVASFIPYAVVPYTFALVMLLIALVSARRRLPLVVLTALVAVLLAMHVTWVAPLFIRDGRPVTSEPFTVLSLNMRAEGADTDDLVAQAEAADVVVLLEATPSAVAAAVGVGLQDTHPHSAGEALYGRTGSLIYSRFPLTDADPLPATRFPQWAATVAVPEVGPVRVFAVHPCNPFCGPGMWPREHAVVADAVARARDVPVVVAGDFNAVEDHLPMRRLREMGRRSATDLAGAGWLPTYPANSRIPPVIPIDHILVDGRLSATSVQRVTVRGTDHLGLLATLAEA